MDRDWTEYDKIHKEVVREGRKMGTDFDEQRYNELRNQLKEWLSRGPPTFGKRQHFSKKSMIQSCDACLLITGTLCAGYIPEGTSSRSLQNQPPSVPHQGQTSATRVEASC